MSDQQGFTPEHLARIVRWVMIVFFVYVVIYNIPFFGLQDKKRAPVQGTQSASTAAGKPESPDCSGDMFTNFSLFAMPLYPVSSSTIAVSDVTVGKGEVASCGQKATLRYTYATRKGDVIFSNMKNGDVTKDVRLGAGEMLPGFERGLIGMRAGGERDISIPPQLGFAAAKNVETLRDHAKFKNADSANALLARASLISLSPAFPDSDLKLRVIDQSLGNSKVTECGDTVSLKLTIWKMDGTSLYSNESGAPLRITVSASQLPYGIELGVIGMMLGGKRTLILPPAYAKPLFAGGEALLKDVTIPEGEILLAAIEVVADQAAAKPVPSPATPSPATTPTKK